MVGSVNSGVSTLENVGKFMKAAGPWGTALILAICVVVMVFRTDDRYRGIDASEDWKEHSEHHQAEWTNMQSWVVGEINTRVPPKDVIQRLATIEANIATINDKLTEVREDVREIRNGK